MVWLSFSLSVLVMALAGFVQWRVISRRAAAALQPPGMDLLAKSLLDLLGSENAATFSFLIWLFICAIVDVGFPVFLGNRADIFDGWLQRVLSIDYVLLVPVLLGAYIHFARWLRITLPPETAAFRRQVTGFLSLQIVICALALGSQAQTILTQTDPNDATPPILWADRIGWHLNLEGAFHAALRALDGVMVLGLACTVVLAWSRRHTIGGTSLLEERSARIRPEIRYLAFGLMVTLALASFVLWLHLATIIQHRVGPSPGQSPTLQGQFVSAGWIAWFVVWIIAAVLAGNLFLTLHHRAEDEQLRRRRHHLERLEQASHDPAELELLKNIHALQSQIEAEYDGESSWPIPPSLFFGVEAISVVGGAIGGAYIKFLLGHTLASS
jgi:hypothetical protein